MDRELAEELTRKQFEELTKADPNKNDFTIPFEVDGKLYYAIWMRDIEIQKPEWHISVTFD